MSQEAIQLADVYDLLVDINTEPKHRHKNPPYPRPFEKLSPGKETIKGSKMSVVRALDMYATTVETRSAEEINEINRQKLEAKRKQQEAGS